MGRSLRLRLSAMMFLQYFVLGAWVVTLPTFLMAAPPDGGLNLSAEHVGLIISTLSLAATASPLLVGQVRSPLNAACQRPSGCGGETFSRSHRWSAGRRRSLMAGQVLAIASRGTEAGRGWGWLH